MRREVIAWLVGLFTGLFTGLLIAPTGAGADEPVKRDYAETTCRGNGVDGYRFCRVDFERPAKKVAVNIFIGGEFDIGFVWQPTPAGGEWKRVQHQG